MSDLGWSLALSAPCKPYAAVTVTYGPMVFFEELGNAGQVALALPVLPDVGTAEVMIGAEALEVTVPASARAVGFIRIVGQEGQPGLLPQIGFPDPETGLIAEAEFYPTGPTPEGIDVPVRADNCGQSLRFSLMRDGWPGAREITVALPDCALTGAVIRLPLPSE